MTETANLPGARVNVSTCVMALTMLTVSDQIVGAGVLMAAALPGSTISLSLIGLAVGLPFLFAGWMGRRLQVSGTGPGTATLVGSGMGALAGVGLALTLGAGDAHPVLLCASLALTTVSGVIINATWMSSLPAILPDATRRRRTLGVTATVTAAGAAAGPALAAFLFPTLGPVTVCLLYILVNVVGGVAMALAMGARPQTEPQAEAAWRWSVRLTGIKGIARSRRARGPVVVQIATNLIVYGVIYSLPLRAAQEAWQPSWVAIGMTALLGGTITGSALATVVPSHRLYTSALRVEPLLRATMLMLFAFAPAGYPGLLYLFLFSLPQGFGRVARQSMMIEEFPSTNRLPVMATYRGLLGVSMTIAPFVMERTVGLFGTFGYTLGCALALLALFVLQAIDTPKEDGHDRRR